MNTSKLPPLLLQLQIIIILIDKTICYITYDMDFRFVPGDTVCFGKMSHFD